MTGVLNIDNRSEVILLDDEVDEANRLKEELEATLDVRCTTITDLKDLKKLLESRDFDAASVDWEWNESERGPEILMDLEKWSPNSGRTVFTKHELRLPKASLFGADNWLLKPRDRNYSDYRGAIEKSIIVGIKRKIRILLASDADKTEKKYLMDISSEKGVQELRFRAKYYYSKSRAVGSEDVVLRGLLERIKWLKEEAFDYKAFVNMTWVRRVFEFARFAEVSRADLARVLDITFREVQLCSEWVEPHQGNGSRIKDGLTLILALFGYLFRLSGNDPNQMYYFWRVKDYFALSSERPPWDGQGLRVYLEKEGRPGLVACVGWIREN